MLVDQDCNLNQNHVKNIYTLKILCGKNGAIVKIVAKIKLQNVNTSKKYQISFFFLKSKAIVEKVSPYLGIVIHLVLGSWLETDFSSSSKPPVFLSFLTKLLTAFSLHLSSPSAFFQPRRRFTTGSVKGRMDVIIDINKSFIRLAYHPVQT